MALLISYTFHIKKTNKIFVISGQEIKMAIWGSKATQFDLPEDPNTEDRPAIVLFTGCLVK